MAQIPDREPTPAFAAMVAEELDRLLATLDDETLRRIALEKMNGYTNEETLRRLLTHLGATAPDAQAHCKNADKPLRDCRVSRNSSKHCV